MKMKLNRWLLSSALCLLLASALPAHAFYNPSTGRWLSRDPIEELGGLNRYRFVDNVPIGATDPDGRIKVSTTDLVVNKCGGFEATFMFKMDTRESPEGYIVQEITLSETLLDWDNKPEKVNFIPGDHYWEAWTLAAAPPGGTLKVPDTSSRPESWGHNGKGTYNGNIRFYPKTITKELNAANGAWQTGVPGTGNLLITFTKPTWWALPPPEPEGSRSVTFDFKCTCPWLYNDVTTNPAK